MKLGKYIDNIIHNKRRYDTQECLNDNENDIAIRKPDIMEKYSIDYWLDGTGNPFDKIEDERDVILLATVLIDYTNPDVINPDFVAMERSFLAMQLLVLYDFYLEIMSFPNLIRLIDTVTTCTFEQEYDDMFAHTTYWIMLQDILKSYKPEEIQNFYHYFNIIHSIPYDEIKLVALHVTDRIERISLIHGYMESNNDRNKVRKMYDEKMVKKPESLSSFDKTIKETISAESETDIDEQILMGLLHDESSEEQEMEIINGWDQMIKNTDRKQYLCEITPNDDGSIWYHLI